MGSIPCGLLFCFLRMSLSLRMSPSVPRGSIFQLIFVLSFQVLKLSVPFFCCRRHFDWCHVPPLCREKGNDSDVSIWVPDRADHSFFFPARKSSYGFGFLDIKNVLACTRRIQVSSTALCPASHCLMRISTHRAALQERPRAQLITCGTIIQTSKFSRQASSSWNISWNWHKRWTHRRASTLEIQQTSRPLSSWQSPSAVDDLQVHDPGEPHAGKTMRLARFRTQGLPPPPNDEPPRPHCSTGATNASLVGHR